MANLFNALEVLELGLQIERNGERFYSEVARTTPHEAVRCLFEYLAAEERMHQALFAEIMRNLEKVSDLERPSLSGEPEYVNYIRALAGSRPFGNPEEAASKARSLKGVREILGLAYRHVMDAILLYRELANLTPEDLGGAAVERIVREEEAHLAKLHELEDQLLQKKEQRSQNSSG